MNKQETYRGRQKAGVNSIRDEGPRKAFPAGDARAVSEVSMKGGAVR